MAKQHSNNSDPGEVVIFFARARGGGEVVAHSVRALAEAVERATQPRPQVRVVQQTLPGTKPEEQQERTLFNQDEEETEGADFAPAESVNDGTPVSNGSRKKRGEGDPQDRNAGIEMVGDIQFVPAEKESLKAYVARKSPSSDMHRILVFCDFLENILEMPKYGVGHILTGFRHVGKPVPKDLRQTIRNMKKKVWLSFADLNEIRLTTEGKNVVEHALPENNAKAGA